MLTQQANRPIDKAVRPDRTGGVQVQDNLRMILLVLSQPIEGMLEDRQISRAVSGKFRRTQEGSFSSKMMGNLGDFRVIRGHNHACHCLRL